MKTKYNPMMFLAEDDGGGGGGTDVLDPPQLTPEPEPDPTPDPTPAPPVFDQAAFASAIAEGIRQGTPAPQQRQEKPLTPEEAKKLLNVWEPDDEFARRLMNVETQKAALAEMRDGLIKHADTINQLRLQEQRQQWEQEVAPLRQYVTTQEAAARESRFDAMFKELAAPAIKPIVNATIGALAQQGLLKGKSESDAFKLIATTVEAFAKQTNPNFKLTPSGSSPSGKQQTNGNALRPQSSGSGGGGAGGGDGNAGGKGNALALKFL